MLQLVDIVKEYGTEENKVHALKGVSINFRSNEFVSILGHSGCGKTTLLNIIGGLDRYTSGDLIIKGKSTKKYKDKDWDAYRNHSIGFVFQSYNLIPHQTVLANVELALTVSGVSKSERTRRAKEVLNKVGLGDQLNKKPNQMSGGQMQRVAIARALINDPEILLADEPTGALDTETSVQIMGLLKEIAKDRLVIMVTHNPELAEEYSTRIVKLLDGEIVDDSDPFDGKEENYKIKDAKELKHKRMSFFTALSLSLNNLRTKKGRTLLTAFAGSIGIIGIALILSLSSGFQSYISDVEEDTLSTYPVSITQESVDISSVLTSISGSTAEEINHDLDKVYSNNIMSDSMSILSGEVQTNDLSSFKEYIEGEGSSIKDYATDIIYGYNITINAYTENVNGVMQQVNPNQLTMMGGSSSSATTSGSTMLGMSSYNVWSEILENEELLTSQYDLVAGSWPDSYDEVILVTDENNEIMDYDLYVLGLRDVNELNEIMNSEEKVETEQSVYTYEELLDVTFKVVPSCRYYQYDEATGLWVDMSADSEYVSKLIEEGIEVKISGIVRPNDTATVHSISTTIGYRHDLVTHLIEEAENSEVVKYQQENPDINIFTGLPFGETAVSGADSSASGQMSAEEMQEYPEMMGMSSGYESLTYENVLSMLGMADLDSPSSISFYPINFEAKEEITNMIDEYNRMQEEAGEEYKEISYTDYIGVMMSSVTDIINTISYVLIAFVAISLVVSSIMIGIITYISVLERTKEIGILRSIGASKKDISRVFNAETIIIGFVAGMLGIIITILLNIPINIIIENIAGIAGVSKLPVAGGTILVIISVVLTMIAGLIPSRVAAKKDPVVALRTE